MLDAVQLPEISALAPGGDLVGSVVGFLETTFPLVKIYLSWEDELQSVGIMVAELY